MDEILTEKALWSGISLASIGALWSAITSDGASGALVMGGGAIVVIYGLISAGRERAVQNAFRRAQLADERLEREIAAHEACRLEKIRLRAKLADYEANDDPPTPKPS